MSVEYFVHLGICLGIILTVNMTEVHCLKTLHELSDLLMYRPQVSILNFVHAVHLIYYQHAIYVEADCCITIGMLFGRFKR